jgi:uncharacterized protein with HEPN domain
MARSPGERLQDMRQAAIDFRNFIADMGTAAFHALPHADRMGFRAIKNALTELGEAAKAIPEETRARHADVDWKGFAGLRDMTKFLPYCAQTKVNCRSLIRRRG